jgi:hypothetical protein
MNAASGIVYGTAAGLCMWIALIALVRMVLA